MSFLPKALLFLFLFFLLCFSSAVFFLKKLEAKKEEEVFLVCQKILQEEELIEEFLKIDQGFETFKSEQFLDFEKQWEALFISYQEEARFLDEIPQNNDFLPEECLTTFFQNGQILSKTEKRLAYLKILKKGYEDFQETSQYLDNKGFAGLSDEWVKQKRESFQEYERTLEDSTAPDELEEIDTQFKKTVRAYVELWTNTEVALTRQTPVIYTSSYRVFKEDFNQLIIDLEKLEMLP